MPLVQRSGFLFQFLGLCLLVLVVSIGLSHLMLRYWLLPNIDHYRNDIAHAITQAAGQRVTIGSISAHWDGLHPHLILRKVIVRDKEDKPALILNRLESIPAWRSLISGELRFHEIRIDQPNLTVYRDYNGVLHVAGITLGEDQVANQSGFLNWLLYQRYVDVVNARIFWKDEKRGAPLLELKRVSLHLDNHNNSNHHRFGLRAIPPAELASPLDIRGDFTGEQLNVAEQWHGQLFVKLNYADIAAWQSWFPVLKTTEINRGTGAIQMQINFDKGDIEWLIADVHLKNIKTRLTHELPELDLVSLQGRVGWKKINNKTGKGSELFANQLGASIRGELELQPVDFLLQDVLTHDGRKRSGKLSVKRLDLKTLGGLVEYLPIDGTIRDNFKKLLPHGEIQSIRAEWDGMWADPVNLRVKGKFNRIGMRSFKSLPAFRGISGNININKKGGALNINSQKVSLDLPNLFQKTMMFDTFAGNINWDHMNDNDKGSINIEFSDILFANSHLSGGVNGTYHTEHEGPGEIDLVGYLTQGDARFVGHYLPILDEFPHEWLSKSIVSGELSDVKLRLKGRLASFPFRNNEHGIFQISMKATKGVLDYVPGWPKIEDISANLLFQGSSMEINASKATMSDTNLSKINVQIADMMASDVKLQINGMASGATKQFIKFYTEHVVDIFPPDQLDSFHITGNGELLLNLIIPLPFSDDIKLVGNYLFNNNRVDPGLHMPNLEKINGVLRFTESTINTEKIRAQILGGAVAFNSAIPKDGGISLTAVGKINLDNLLQLNQGRPTKATSFWTKYIRGSTDWSAVVKIHNETGDKQHNLLIESSLQGITSELPEPFSKIAADTIPFRLEKNITDLKQNLMKINYGKQVAARVLFSHDGSMLLTGKLSRLHLDKWRVLLNRFNSFKKTDNENKINLGLSGIDLHVGVLDFFGRRFNNLALNANFRNGEWYSTILSREIDGQINWHLKNEGKVFARLKKLTVPDVYPVEPTVVKKKELEEKSLPSLDILADRLVISGRDLGKLKLFAMQKEEGWKIEELNIVNQDSSFIAGGIWKNRSVAPRIDMNIKLKANDLNKFLTRFGYPDRIKRGKGSLDGDLSWLGGPQVINYETLSGKVNLHAKHGQFPKFELGIGKLFGIFDLKALPRRVILDFRDVFADGFGFDKVSGSASILDGIASTNNLRIGGPAADVKMDGEVNLFSETYKLHFMVIPSLGLATPVVDIATIIVNKAQKDSIKPHEYSITGTWEKPIVTKLH